MFGSGTTYVEYGTGSRFDDAMNVRIERGHASLLSGVAAWCIVLHPYLAFLGDLGISIWMHPPEPPGRSCLEGFARHSRHVIRPWHKRQCC